MGRGRRGEAEHGRPAEESYQVTASGPGTAQNESPRAVRLNPHPTGALLPPLRDGAARAVQDWRSPGCRHARPDRCAPDHRHGARPSSIGRPGAASPSSTAERCGRAVPVHIAAFARARHGALSPSRSSDEYIAGRQSYFRPATHAPAAAKGSVCAAADVTLDGQSRFLCGRHAARAVTRDASRTRCRRQQASAAGERLLRSSPRGCEAMALGSTCRDVWASARQHLDAAVPSPASPADALASEASA